MRKGRRSRNRKKTQPALTKSQDTRIWICDTQNRVYYDARTTMTLEQFNASYGDPRKTRKFIKIMIPRIPHSGEWILRLLILPESYNGQSITQGTSIYDPHIEYIGISVIYMSI